MEKVEELDNNYAIERLETSSNSGLSIADARQVAIAHLVPGTTPGGMMLTNERANGIFMVRSQAGALPRPVGARRRAYGLSDIGQLAWRYRRFILSFIAAGTVLALIASMVLTPSYTAASAIVFDRNDTRPYEAVVEAQKQERDKSAMETELDVIRSRVFVGLVVDALKLTEDPFYNTYLPRAAPEDGNWIDWVSYKLGDAAGGRRDVKNGLVSANAQRDRAITTLLGSFSVDRNGESLAMTIKVTQSDPERAAEVANAIARHYVGWTSNLKKVATADTVTFLRKQADDYALSIAQKEREIAAFTSISDMTFDPKDDLLRSRLNQLNEQFTLARVDEAGAWAKVNEFKLRLDSAGQSGVGRVAASELMTSLRSEEARLERLRAQLTAKFGNNHPLVVDADAELASNRKMMSDEAGRILQELENNAKVASVRARNFETEVGLLQERMKSRNLAEIRRRELERDLLSEQKRYDAVVLRLGTLNPEQEEVKATASVVSFAEVPGRPTFPQPAFLAVAGFLGSTILAVVFIIVADALDDRLRRPEAVEELLDRPNLITVPDFRKSGDPSYDVYEAMLRNPDSVFAKTIRNLCLAWRAMVGTGGGKVVMFASTSVGDGKTTMSLSMAAMARTYGLRTVVVDLDPSPRGAASLSGIITADEGGIESFISRNGKIEDIVSVARVYPFIDFVAARLALNDCEPLFAALRDQYDLVVVDTPALEEGEDAIWIAPQMDMIFMVVASGKTREGKLSEAVQRLSAGHGVIVGSILNFHGRPKRRDVLQATARRGISARVLAWLEPVRLRIFRR